MDHPRLRQSLSRRAQIDRLSGRNVEPFPRHSFLKYNFDFQPFVPPLRVDCCGDDEWVEGCFRRRENSSIFVIEFVYAGNMLFRTSRREYLVEPGMAFFVTPGSTTEMETGPIGFCRKMAAFLAGPLLMPAIKETGLSGVDVVTLGKPHSYIEVVNAVCREMKAPSRATAIALGTLAWELLLQVAAGLERRRRPEPLQAATDFIDANLDRPVSLDEVCRAAGCSCSALSRLFRRHLGVSPVKYGIQQRMSVACHMLHTTFLSVKEISVRCGYRNQLYFSMEFRKRFGVCPSEWRKGARGT